MLTRTAAAVAAICVAAPLAAAEPEFWLIDSQQDFLAGEVEGLSVDSGGHLRLAPGRSELADPEAPYVWCLAADDAGTLYAGAGNEGRIYKIHEGEVSLLFDANELEVHALAVGPDARIYAATSPDGKVYAISRDGAAEVFYDPSDKYIWGLAFDADGRLLVATGLEGRLHRVDEDGEAVIVLSTTEAHLTALATDQRGQAFVGSAPSGIVYRVGSDDKVFALHDSEFREVKALAVAPNGDLYAALLEGASAAANAAPMPPQQQAPQPAGDHATNGSDVTISVQATPVSVPPAGTSQQAGGGQSKGALLRVRRTGEVDRLWSSGDESPHSLAWTRQGVLLGTGGAGKLYRVADDGAWEMLSAFPSEQITALGTDRNGRTYVATSNPGRFYVLEDTPGASGRFVSKVLDTKTVSSWGRVRWQTRPASGAVSLRVRSGNTGKPDSTWSDWVDVAPEAAGAPIGAERARFVQLEARLMRGDEATTPLLDWISVAYLQRNLEPQVTSITVHPPGVVFQQAMIATGQIELLGLPDEEQPERPKVTRPNAQQVRMANMSAFSRPLYQRGIQTFAWEAEDPNGDDLAYAVDYRAADDDRFRPLRTGLTESVLAWDTSTVPNGRYVMRVRASDSPSNPASLALSASRESGVFEVDNTPPQVEATLESRKPVRVRAVARDADSLVGSAQYSVDGGRWNEVHPLDGINDSHEEIYAITPELPDSPGPHIVVVRARDRLGNVATAQVEIP